MLVSACLDITFQISGLRLEVFSLSPHGRMSILDYFVSLEVVGEKNHSFVSQLNCCLVRLLFVGGGFVFLKRDAIS